MDLYVISEKNNKRKRERVSKKDRNKVEQKKESSDIKRRAYS